MSTIQTFSIPTLESSSASVLRSLRDLLPPRTLSMSEALQRAEIQAAKFLKLVAAESVAFPTEAVLALPKISVKLHSRTPLAGSSHWEDGQWQILINRYDRSTRQRFSLLHEYKHIVDHGSGNYIEGIVPTRSSEHSFRKDVYEKVADHFAACVLMPKSKLTSAFCGITQDVERLADMFDVSQSALRIRLTTLGLLESPGRCAGRPTSSSYRKRAA